MEFSGMMGGFYRISLWVSRFAYIHLLWILFCLLGGIVLGFMPATTALFAIARKWIHGDTEIPVYKTYWQEYRACFMKSNLIGGLLLFIGGIIGLNFLFVQGEGPLMAFIRYVLLVCSLLYLVVLLYIFPTLTNYELKPLAYVRTSLVLGIAYPHFTIMMVLSLFALQYILMTLPGLLLFFGASLVCYPLMWLADKTFSQVIRKEKAKDDVAMGQKERKHKITFRRLDHGN